MTNHYWMLSHVSPKHKDTLFKAHRPLFIYFYSSGSKDHIVFSCHVFLASLNVEHLLSLCVYMYVSFCTSLLWRVQDSVLKNIPWFLWVCFFVLGFKLSIIGTKAIVLTSIGIQKFNCGTNHLELAQSPQVEGSLSKDCLHLKCQL